MDNPSLITNGVYKNIKMRRKNDSAENNDVENLQYVSNTRFSRILAENVYAFKYINWV